MILFLIPPGRRLRVGPVPLGEASLVSPVVVPVGPHGVARTLVLVGHTLRRLLKGALREPGRDVAEHILELGPRAMILASTIVELSSQCAPKLVQPLVVLRRLTSPDGRRMVLVSSFVALLCPRAVRQTMRGGHELSVLNHHLGAMLVAVVHCSEVRMRGEVENVHDKFRGKGVLEPYIIPECVYNVKTKDTKNF